MQTQNQYLNYLIVSSFHGVNRIFVLPFENNAVRTRHAGYFLPTIEIKDYKVMIDGRSLLYQPIKKDIRTYVNIRKTAFGQGDDYTIGCLLDHPCPKENDKLIGIDFK